MRWMIGLLAACLAFSIFYLPAIAQEDTKEEKKEEAKDEGLPPLPQRAKTLEEAVKKADIIFVGIVDYVGDKPDGWGRPPYRPATQFMRYEVVKFLKGSHEAKKITVIHELFKGSKTADEQPGLNPKIFDIDTKVIILVTNPPINNNPVTFYSNDPDFGAIPWSEDEEKKLCAMIGK